MMNWLKRLVLRTFAPQRLLSNKELKDRLAHLRQQFKSRSPFSAIATGNRTTRIRKELEKIKKECKRRRLPT